MEHFAGVNYKTKRERQAEEAGKSVQDVLTVPDSNLDFHLNVIKAFKAVHADMGFELAVITYFNLRNLRHDNWVEFISHHSNVKIGDVKIPSFLKDELGLINDHILREITRPSTDFESVEECKRKKGELLESMGLLALEHMNKTPDILCFKDGVVYIGDVAVTIALNAARSKKQEKYLPISKWLESKGYETVHQDFVLLNNLYNLQELIGTFRDKGLLDSDIIGHSIFSDYHEAINQSMILCETFSGDKFKFKQVVDFTDGFTPAKIRQVNYKYNQSNLEKYEFKRTEGEIIEMIKKRVELLDSEKYFDCNIETTMNAMDKLLEDISNRPSMQPKSTLKVIDNSHEYEELNDYALISDYNSDIGSIDTNDETKKLLFWLLPNPMQVHRMREIKEKKLKSEDIKNNDKFESCGVHGIYSYDNTNREEHPIVSEIKMYLGRGKDDPNVKEEPCNVRSDLFEDSRAFIECSMGYYGSKSQKPSFMKDEWASATKLEEMESAEARKVYNMVRETNGAQLCNSMSLLYQRIVHTSTRQGSKWVFFTPPNASFICIIPAHHAPFNRANCDIPMMFITRSKKNKEERKLMHCEFEYYCESDSYYYYVSKLCRLNINKIAGWANAGYQYVSSCSYLLTRCPKMRASPKRFLGLMTLMILDCHQKTSEFLDLLKYISFMPFADIHRLPALVEDKMDVLIKTRLDCWMLLHLKKFMKELSEVDKLNAAKPRLRVINNRINKDSMGLNINLPSFIDPEVRHEDATDFIEEINLIYTSRPKHLYGSQFMDKAITNICVWNDEYLEEKEKYGGWAEDGHDKTDFPFGAKFCFSSDAIYYATLFAAKENPINENKLQTKVVNCPMFEYMHYNCSLRGATKEKNDRLNSIDLHSTSADECIKYYKEHDFDDEQCRAFSIACETLRDESYVMQFTKSEKEQRGGGRPIATPTLRTKAMLMCVEKPEVERGKMMANNIIVPGKNKLKEQADNYKNAVLIGVSKGFKKVGQITEDQTKFSENDNNRKCKTFLQTDTNAPKEIRAMQWDIIEKMHSREHLVKRMPKEVLDKHKKWINEDNNGVKAIIGWPQGMFNFISTSIHSIADLWITEAYNIAYPHNKVLTRGLVHSDDSTVVVCYNDMADFKRFALFRLVAKELFCLKLNEKKLWGSRYLGEIVSNYNMNGNVHMSISKTIANSFGNLTYQNWPTDVNNQISTIQQCYRNGANIPTLIMMLTVLKQQLLNAYHVTGYQLKHLHDIPIHMGGFPDNSAFELGVTGVTCHYQSLLSKYSKPKYEEQCRMVCYCLARSKRILSQGTEKVMPIVVSDDWADLVENEELVNKLTTADFESLAMPSKGDVFKCITHLMPKSTKTRKTIDNIRALPFESNGLELIVTRPDTLPEALGNYKAQTSNMFYELAADHYTHSSRRMAMSQVMQSSGRVIRFDQGPAVTINQMLERIMELSVDTIKDSHLLCEAFTDDNDLVDLCSKVVHQSELMSMRPDKRKVLNKMPFIQDKFTTISPINDVLLYLIDNLTKSNYLSRYESKKSNMDIIMRDSTIIKRRFKHYFSFYSAAAACSLIKRQFLDSIKSRLWVQPHMNNETLQTFIEDLYGRTVSTTSNYRVYILPDKVNVRSETKDLVTTLYSTLVLNSMYEDKFKINSIYCNEDHVYKSISDMLYPIDDQEFDNNTKLKLGVLESVLLNDDTRLIKHVRNIDFRCDWIKTQKYANGRYSGRFHAVCSYGKLILHIKGEPGNIRLIASDSNIPKILKAMYMFIDKNFRSHGYNSPYSWGSSNFWRSPVPDTNALIYYSSYSTFIKQASVNDRYVNIDIDTRIKHGTPLQMMKDINIIIRDNFRVIMVDANPKPYRAANIIQNLSLPSARRINIVPNEINGIDCGALYKTNVIIELTLHKDYSITRDQIEKCFDESDFGANIYPIALTYLNIILNIKGFEPIESTQEDDYIYEEVVTLAGMSYAEATEIFMTDQVDDITAEFTDFRERLDFERAGSLARHNNVMLSLCRIYSGLNVFQNVNNFLKIVIKNNKIYDWGVRMIDEMVSKRIDVDDRKAVHEYLKDQLEYFAPTKDVNLELYCFIMASGLHTNEVWSKINLDKLDYHVLTDTNVPYLLSDWFIDAINDAYFGDPAQEENVVTALRRYKSK